MKLKRLFIFLLIIILLVIIAYYYPIIKSTFTGRAANNQEQFVSEKESGIVIKIVDGDTIHVKIDGNDKEETVRLLGINTPEKKKPFYQEAKNFLITEIENKTIELQTDNEEVDKYERKLRYVFYENRLINIEIVENGLATTFMTDNLKYKDKFISAEKFARDNEKALWKKSNDKCAICIKLIKLNPDLDYFIVKNECDFFCNLSEWVVKDDANHFFSIQSLNSFEEKKYDSIEFFKAEVWNDNGDRFFMRDANGNLVIFYKY